MEITVASIKELTILFVLCFLSNITVAQDDLTPTQDLQDLEKSNSNQLTLDDLHLLKETLRRKESEAEPQVWSPTLVIILSMGVLLFGVIVIGIMAFLIFKNRHPHFVLRAFSVPLIVVAAVFLVVTGYNEKQIAPVVGLLGTIAGYILGTMSIKPDDNEPTIKPTDGNGSVSNSSPPTDTDNT